MKTKIINNILPFLYGLLTTIAALIIFTFVLTLILYFTPLSETYVNPIGIIITVLSLIIGGIMMGKSIHKNGLLHGAVLGIIFFIVLVLLNKQGGISLLLPKLPYILISPMIGGIIGVK